MDLRIATDSDSERWNRIVDSAQGGTIFHRWEWLRITEKHSKSKLYPLIVFEGDEPVGILPLFYSRKWLLRMVMSPPLGMAIPTLGPLLVNYGAIKPHKMEHTCKKFQICIDNFISSTLHSDYISITSSPGVLDVRPFIWSGYQVIPLYTYKVDLLQGETAVWNNFTKKLRSDIKRTAPKDIVIQEGNIKDIPYLYNSLEERYGTQKIDLITPLDYLYDLYKEFGSRYLNIFIALSNNQTIGAILFINYKETTSTWLGVAKTGLAGIPINDLIQWEVIKWSIKNDYKTFELVGANTSRLCEFKSKYSPDLEIYFNAKKAKVLGKLGEQVYLKLFKKTSHSNT